MFGFGNSKQKKYKKALEEFLQKMLKIPPLILVLILVTTNYLSKNKLEIIYLPEKHSISLLILLIGIFILINPVFKLIKSKTTVNPIKFKKVNKLVTSGIYKYSRNPIYLGKILIIISTTVFYLNYYSMITPLIFYFWINRFQIKREEVFLKEKFGKEYLLYCSKTRRWI
jgi:protein-S-isoprenylcysteine O-methyltransferase Ste14